MKMMRIPAVWTTNLVALLFGVGMYSIMAFLPEFLQTPSSAGYGFGASITQSGIFLLPMTVTMFAFGLISGGLADRLGSKVLLIVGSGLTAVSFLVLTVAHDEKWQIYLFSALLGAGLGFAFAAMSNIIVVSVPAAQVGVASGMNANIRTIGGSIGAAVMGSIVTSGADRQWTAGQGRLHPRLRVPAHCLGPRGRGRRSHSLGEATRHRGRRRRGGERAAT